MFAGIDGETWMIITTSLGAIGGGLWKIIGWLRTKGAAFIDWGRPKVEEFIDNHNSLMKTLETTQKQGAAELSAIRQQQEANGVTLTKIHEAVCQPTTQAPKVSES